MSDLRMVFEIVGNESASPAIRKVETSLDGLESQARKTGESLKASLGADFAKSLKADVTAATELRDVLQQVAAVQRSMQAAGRTTRTTTAAAGTTEARQVTQAASARARAAATADRTWGAQQRRRVSIMDRSAAHHGPRCPGGHQAPRCRVHATASGPPISRWRAGEVRAGRNKAPGRCPTRPCRDPA